MLFSWLDSLLQTDRVPQLGNDVSLFARTLIISDERTRDFKSIGLPKRNFINSG